ncbi:hypothetical protein GJ496_010418 [Pomphorhynchus laevis]|nr:hypothetical protein GJ496_010418 [Pomphorhynchus laevis]
MLPKQPPILYESGSMVADANCGNSDSRAVTTLDRSTIAITDRIHRRRYRRLNRSGHHLKLRKRNISKSPDYRSENSNSDNLYISPVCKLSRFMLRRSCPQMIIDGDSPPPHENVSKENVNNNGCTERHSARIRMKQRTHQIDDMKRRSTAARLLPLTATPSLVLQRRSPPMQPLQSSLQQRSMPQSPLDFPDRINYEHQVMSPSVSQAIRKLETVDVSKRPNELIRYDFISAMKLPERHVLLPEEFWLIQDKWKAAWHRGVHVPVSTTLAKDVYACEPIRRESTINNSLISSLANADYLPAKQHVLSMSVAHFTATKDKLRQSTECLGEGAANRTTDAIQYNQFIWIKCLYDVDCMDLYWISCIQHAGVNYSVDQFERCIVALEFTCAEQVRSKISQSLTYDNDIVCEVCRSPDAQDNDEMVFCDGCNLCVHQSCYGIKEIPEGDWLCGPCSKGICKGNVSCMLCVCRTGALKPVGSNSQSSLDQKWCHICCALWIPETSIGDLKLMEPIIGIQKIPQARWSLLCYICKVREGACVQCAVKSCLKAFHVTCAIQHNLKMKTTSSRKYRLSDNRSSVNGCRRSSPPQCIRKSRSSGSLFIAFCDEHSCRRPSISPQRQLNSPCSSNKSSTAMKTPNQLTNTKYIKKIRKNRLTPSRIAKEFYRLVNINQISCCLCMDNELCRSTYMYWKDKRMLNNNKPLIERLPSSKPCDRDRWNALHEYLNIDPDQESTKLILITLRQQLEVARNLCYLISRRERLKRDLYTLRLLTPLIDLNTSPDDSHTSFAINRNLSTFNRYCGRKFPKSDSIMYRKTMMSISNTDHVNLFPPVHAPGTVIDGTVVKRPRGRPRKYPLPATVDPKAKKCKFSL